jgi:arylsulfatase A-like enzyme
MVRGLATAQAVAILLLFFALQQSPRAFHVHSIGHPVNSHVLKLWYVQNFSRTPFSGLDSEAGRTYGHKVQAGTGINPGAVLAEFRDFHESQWVGASNGTTADRAGRERAAPHEPMANGVAGRNGALPVIHAAPAEQAAAGRQARARFTSHLTASGNGGEGTAAGSEQWPLLRDFRPSPERTRALRRELGLPEQGPVHVIMLLVEGLRYYEVQHPYLGPRVHPRINRLLAEHGILFSRSYTSSSSAGQTVRGSFSTYCSFLPNIKGPATYIAYSTIRIRCLPELMKENGYTTLWFNSHRKNSHNKNFFEGGNGVDHFYDREYFWAQGINDRVGEWGLGDQPVLQATLKKLEQWAEGDKPVYAQVVTVSTHTPVAAAPGIRFDDEFERILAQDKSYRDFMSMFRYTDEAVGDFLDGLFSSKMGASTVVFMLGDHSNGEVPVKPFDLDPVQYMDARFRTPIAVLTKAMPRPHVRGRIVHQVDVAPSAATVAGVSGKVTWVGRGLFHPHGEGTPWVYETKGKVYWRTQTRGCYGGECYDLTTHDPMTQRNPPPLPPQTELERFFVRVIESNGIAIGGNRISPIN